MFNVAVMEIRYDNNVEGIDAKTRAGLEIIFSRLEEVTRAIDKYCPEGMEKNDIYEDLRTVAENVENSFKKVLTESV